MSEHGIKSEESPELPLDAPAELPLPPLPRPPFWMVSLALISVVGSWIPLALIARARVVPTTEPRISIIQDMGKQPKYREQEINPVFIDHRAMRPKIPGTVSRTGLEDDAHYYFGFTTQTDAAGKIRAEYFTTLPDQVLSDGHITGKLLARGQNRFNIYCYVCHGYDGSGNGPVNQRAMELQADYSNMGNPKELGMNWTKAAMLTSVDIRHMPDGVIFNVISNGVRAMPAYGEQITVQDRWAIVAYIRALQFSRSAPDSVLTPEQRADLK